MVAAAGDQSGFLLSLVTESFAVRALLGSLAAASLAALAVRYDVVQGRRARRLVVLAPVLAAATAALASLIDAEVYLPQLWLTSATTSEAANQVIDLLWDLRAVANDRPVDVLALVYAGIAGTLLLRRAAGAAALRRSLRRAVRPAGEDGIAALASRLADRTGTRPPRVVLLQDCPGGAFTAGIRHPVIAVDPELLTRLDWRELEGLLAHELAHIRRRDGLLGVAVGVFRDVTFFLPPIYLVDRWLRVEQEESADELASAHTGRPAALASGILKVWETGRGQRRLPLTCAAVTASNSGELVSARVERLIDHPPTLPRWRRRAETVLAAGVVAVGTGAALTMPGWVASAYDTNGLAVGYVPVQASTPTESPAFATFRHLVSQTERDNRLPASAVSPGQPEAAGCPCVETSAQLREEEAATGSEPRARMLWRRTSEDPWRLDSLGTERSVHPARPVLTLRDSGPQVGVFVMGRSRP